MPAKSAKKGVLSMMYGMQRSSIFVVSLVLAACAVFLWGCRITRPSSKWESEEVLPVSYFSTLHYYTSPTRHQVMIEFGSVDSFLSYVRFSSSIINQNDSLDIGISIWGAVTDAKSVAGCLGDIQRIKNGNYGVILTNDAFDPESGKVYYYSGTEYHEIPYKGVRFAPFCPYMPPKESIPLF